MKNNTSRITALFLTGALLLSGCGGTDTANNATSANTDISSADTDSGNTFSAMSTTDLDGNPVDASIFSDSTITLVNAWNVGCTPCVNEIPALNKLNSDYADKGAAVIGLYNDLGSGISDDEMNQIKEILNNADASYTQLRVDGTLASDSAIINMMVFPTTYIVNSEGTILDTIQGANDYEGWKAVMDSYLTEGN